MNSERNLPIVVGITGASGAVYAHRLLEMLIQAERPVQLTISRSGKTVLQQELGLDVDLDRFSAADLELGVGDHGLRYIHYYHFDNYFSAPASGSAPTAGMVVCPCSGGTLSAVAHGSSTTLVQRAAEVHLKERRKLVLVLRETPLSLAYIDNMRRVCEAGGVVLPAAPGWYHGVEHVSDLVDFVVARVLDQLRVAHSLMDRWGDGFS
ncbi:MAG: UbiX family flavin prenyltransferase [Planctomycetota bacterium]